MVTNLCYIHTKQTDASNNTGWRKRKHNCRFMGSVWVFFFCFHIQDPCILLILQVTHAQPVSWLQLLLFNAH